MDIKKHLDTFALMAMMFSGLLWMNGKFNDIENRLTRVETILYMRGLIHNELAIKEQ